MLNGKRHVLLLEDDDLVARSVKRACKRLELEFHTCSRVEEASAYLQSNFELVDLVLTDIDLPDGSSIKLHDTFGQRLREAGKGYLAMTGRPNSRHAKDYEARGVCVLAKPFSVEQIRSALMPPVPSAA